MLVIYGDIWDICGSVVGHSCEQRNTAALQHMPVYIYTACLIVY